jgi:hypothetical protein
MTYCVAREIEQFGQNATSAAFAPSGWNLVALHAVEMLPSGPANTTVCGQAYADVRADVDWYDVKANTVTAPRCDSCKTETGFNR